MATVTTHTHTYSNAHCFETTNDRLLVVIANVSTSELLTVFMNSEETATLRYVDDDSVSHAYTGYTVFDGINVGSDGSTIINLVTNRPTPSASLDSYTTIETATHEFAATWCGISYLDGYLRFAIVNETSSTLLPVFTDSDETSEIVYVFDDVRTIYNGYSSFVGISYEPDGAIIITMKNS